MEPSKLPSSYALGGSIVERLLLLKFFGFAVINAIELSSLNAVSAQACSQPWRAGTSGLAKYGVSSIKRHHARNKRPLGRHLQVTTSSHDTVQVAVLVLIIVSLTVSKYIKHLLVVTYLARSQPGPSLQSRGTLTL